jgi:hypothetical protein
LRKNSQAADMVKQGVGSSFRPPHLMAAWARVALIVLAGLAASPVAALDQSDAGVYAIVHVDGHVTTRLMRVLHPDGRWEVEEQEPDGSWKNVTCEDGCVMAESLPADVEKFLGKAPKDLHAECINNMAFAICRVSDQVKPGQRQYLFVGFTKKGPVVLRLAPQNSAEGWRDRQGDPVADTDDRKSVDGFGGWLIVTSDADWKKKWETPSDTTPDFTTARKVPRGKRVFVLSFFVNPRLDAEGKAEVRCDIDLAAPDGTIATHQEDLVCFQGPLKDPRLVYLSGPVVGFSGDPGDPGGDWEVRVTLRDKVRNVAVPLKTSFTLMDGGAPEAPVKAH